MIRPISGYLRGPTERTQGVTGIVTGGPSAPRSRSRCLFDERLYHRLATCPGECHEPGIGQQFLEPVLRLGRESREDVPEIGEGIDVMVLTGAGEGVEDRRRPAATVAPEGGQFLR